ncbi:MAG TPA: hypothetical protein V6C65_37005, partial [Allocoleopsis sp.]
MSGELSIQKFLLVQQGDHLSEQRKKLGQAIDDKVTAVDRDQIEAFKQFPGYVPETTPGYFVFSTAPFNIEDGNAELVVDLTPAMKQWRDRNLGQISDPPIKGRKNVRLPVRNLDRLNESEKTSFPQGNLKAAIQSIAKDLKKASESGTPAELVIAIHGYSTEQTNVRRWYKKIFHYVNHEAPLKDKKNLVFIGYRWSSEQVNVKENLPAALAALPLLPRYLLIAGGIGIILFTVLAIVSVSSWADFLLTVLLLLATSAASIIFSLVILRVIVYFRDNYRANNFAVPDLVEFIRKLDAALQEEFSQIHPQKEIKVNLSFIGHSMGGFVATNAIRILSDVFYQDKVEQEQGQGRRGRLSSPTDQLFKPPSSIIGQVFCLKRLVLASPDIPVLTILTGRANFLAASLRRFDEAYLFSNEGDLALRLASTAANYFSFPAKTRSSGYRLGNVTVEPNKGYGIVNLSNLKDFCPQNGEIQFRLISPALKSLFVSNIDGVARKDGSAITSLEDFAKRYPNYKNNHLSIADLFTYFDCTDYIEIADKNDPLFKEFYDENEKYRKFITSKRLKEVEALSQKAIEVPRKVVGVLSRAKGAGSRSKPRSLTLLDYAQLIRDYRKGRDVHGGYFAAPFSQKLIYQLAFMGFHEFLTSSYDSNRSNPLQQFDQNCK